MNSEDRELLELAAKAAGYRVREYAPGKFHCDGGVADGVWMFWNPIDDDGDAFRLMVKVLQDETIDWLIWEHGGNVESTADVRRAITRVAAEIGRRMA
jgi:hypothetical protein